MTLWRWFNLLILVVSIFFLIRALIVLHGVHKGLTKLKKDLNRLHEESGLNEAELKDMHQRMKEMGFKEKKK